MQPTMESPVVQGTALRGAAQPVSPRSGPRGAGAGAGLGERDCLDLLAVATHGRIALSIGALPAILPVTFCLVDGRILFLAPDGQMPASALSGTVVAFQADHVDPVTRAGWHVHAVGVARVSADPLDRKAAEGAGLKADGLAATTPLIAFHPGRLTGWHLPGAAGAAVAAGAPGAPGAV